MKLHGFPKVIETNYMVNVKYTPRRADSVNAKRSFFVYKNIRSTCRRPYKF